MPDPVETLIDSLIKEGKALAKLFSNAKILQNKDKTNQAKQEMLNNIHASVTTLIPVILKGVDDFQLSPSFPEKIIPKVLGKIQATLQEFIKLDPENASGYEELVKGVTACNSRKQNSAVRSSFKTSVPLQSESPTSDSTQLQASTSDNPKADQLDNLNNVEMQCLLCFCLYPDGVEVKKREPIHLWIGMGFIDDQLKGVEVLAKLVAEGFVERTIGNKKLYNRYKINKTVRDMVTNEMNINFTSFGSLSIMDKPEKQPPPQQTPPQQKQHQQHPLPPQQQPPLRSPPQQQPTLPPSHQQPTLPLDQEPPSPQQQQPQLRQQQQPQPQQQQQQQPLSQQQQQPLPPPMPRQQQRMLSRITTLLRKPRTDEIDVSGSLVLNVDMDSLHAKTFEQLSKNKNNVKVLHLGSWQYHNSKRYIVVEDNEVLKTLTKHIGQVTFLSLQGISGIVELPDSVYKLENLKVLDLRACPNLESLSEGIESLKHLTHLDLSECYLLDHIPEGIAELTEPRVLKGYVINPDEQEPQESKQKGKGKENGSGKNALSNALFSDLSRLNKLEKLTIRTRKKSFPTSDDLDTLSKMYNLTSLGIAWVQSTGDEQRSSASGRFPKSLKKLELQAAPEDTMSQLLRLISEDTENSLEKLYIRGGRLWDLGMEMHQFSHVHSVRLRYLLELRIDWDEFWKFFPKLSRLEVSGCPNLIFFPCDENGAWEEM